jgi:hypothetical protein
MSQTQIRGTQILDGSITSEDIDDAVEKDYTRVRVTTSDSAPDFLSSKLVQGTGILLETLGASGSSQTIRISSTGGVSGGGDITAVLPGSNITGGGQSGDVTLSLSNSIVLTAVTASLYGTASYALSSGYSNTSSTAANAVSSSYALSAGSSNVSNSAITSLTASFVSPLTQDILITGSLYINGPAAPATALKIANGDLELADSIRLKAGSAGQFLLFNAGGNTQLQSASGHMLFIAAPGKRFEYTLGSNTNSDIFRIRDGSTNTKFSVDGTGLVAVTNSLNVGSATNSKQFQTPLVTLADAATITWDVTSGSIAQVTLGGNRTLGALTGALAGTVYTLIVKQDATGSRALSYHSSYKFAYGAAPVLTTGPNAVDIITFLYDGVSAFGVAQQDFR